MMNKLKSDIPENMWDGPWNDPDVFLVYGTSFKGCSHRMCFAWARLQIMSYRDLERDRKKKIEREEWEKEEINKEISKKEGLRAMKQS